MVSRLAKMQFSEGSTEAQQRHVKYARIQCPLNVYDFTPARVTRRSDNPLLQDHCILDQLTLYDTVRRPTSAPQPLMYSVFLSHAAESQRHLRGKYVELQFADSYPGCELTPAGLPLRKERGESDVALSSHEIAEDYAARSATPTPADPPTSCSPLFIRSRTERRRTAFRKRSDDTKTGGCGIGSLSTSTEEDESAANCSQTKDSGSTSEVAILMDIQSGVVMYHGRLAGAPPAPALLNNPVGHRQHDDCEFTAPRRLVRPVPFQLPTADTTDGLREPPYSPPRSHHPLPSSPPSYFGGMRPSVGWQQNEGVPTLMGNLEEVSSDGDCLDVYCESSDIVSSGNHHQPLSRQSLQTVPTSPISHPPTSSAASSSSSNASNHRHSKPLPPPKARSQGDMFDSTIPTHGGVKSNQTVSTPDLAGSTLSAGPLTGSSPRLRSVSFLNCSAGDHLGQFPADYLGSRQKDSFMGHADSVAKELINSKPVEVVVYVSSEKIRLAPPKNSSLLFKSFAVKDILSVEKCTKNRRIVCVSVWKSRRALPQCHALRCPSALVSNALYDSILDQTQNVDDITPHCRKLSSAVPEVQSSSSMGDSISTFNDREVPTPYLPLPSSTPDSLSSDTPSEFLHKIPATHIGSTAAGRHDSVNDIIQKVLQDHTPMGSREISVWLSLAQLRLVDMTDEREMVYEAQETNRIRAIGVHLEDKRFIGYIVKEEGKPLLGHVLRCNSAALMVSLVSFLRQACQIMFTQQGGSLYDELSSDESEYESSTESPVSGQGLLKKLRCIANPHKPLSKSTSQPSFVSHTPPPRSPTSRQSSPLSPSFITPPISPLDVPEEQYSRFSVTYVGSAVSDPPFSPDSLTHALSVFKEGGVAAGKAAVAKNVIQMHVSSLGVNLVDKKHRLFVNRNYPRKQVVGYCRHGNDEKLFAFASIRQGYPDEIKVHMFRRLEESTEQIIQAFYHWLKLPPLPTGASHCH